MVDQFFRTRMLFGDAAIMRLQRARVAVFGIGGVGGFAAEALVRSGLGAIDLIDDDKVSRTNLNRQIIATLRTIGRNKVDVMYERLHDINPECAIVTHKIFYLPETADDFDFCAYDYVIDALDTVSAKCSLIVRADALHKPIISAMGAGNKTDPTAIRISDIYGTSICPLARVMRKELRSLGVKKLKVAFSLEPPINPITDSLEIDQLSDPQDYNRFEGGVSNRPQPGSTAFVPAAMGLAIAAEVAGDLMARLRCR